ncbi:MAG: osmotically inducible protein OsmC [Stygiobacter sp. RIFOXYC12_FULL_38_8]|nr:MAG: osmotically inducible protein OsmC [Stygiobacter sp. GWC2_38_9]OGU81255.1 MAG: osmotically inducible protein OsmC [Stygiobacter sp. RIFOXYA12_FULL_38_9]OGV08590.1 MAG: osmotically inducible protein OsmC [Stygiobacter sp. RIFOXYB2_FULL_37_11]OGV11817.1 MAG: osmotically inducible protein OsmC [Stygiobacter sp. RIFOXYA2_FULL_38_8]OGV12523.1 MAG: osmotically inducible protein OsmC [Stygiobacter sp. RIFOXYC2_FULL_38_25]OGV24153.1 MAG: osmotically inducible protein OsmC [Stygiobacter sp. RIF
MAEKKAVVKHIKGVTFMGKADSNHWVTMDGPEEFGGSNAGTRPKELLLLALGGCTGSDVAVILKKKKINVEGFEINLTAEMQETHPQVYTKINVEYVFYGSDIPKEAVERAIELSQKTYCSVTAMLQKAVEITHSYRIEEAK